MKTLIITLTIAVISLTASCGSKLPQIDDAERWQYIRSPLSGRCYEIFSSRSYGGNPIGSISEIPCTQEVK